MAKRKKRREGDDRPLADRASEAGEELGPEAPVVTQLADERAADEDGVGLATAAGVTAAGESDRPAGVHVAPEYPAGEVPAEIDVDAVYSIDGEEEPPVRLEDRAERPVEPVPPDHADLTGPLADDDLADEGFALGDDPEEEIEGERPPAAHPSRARTA